MIPAIGIAWVTFAALTLVIANEVAMPLDFLVRPLLFMVLPAAAIGTACLVFGRFSTLATVVICALVLLPGLWPLAAGVAVVDVGISFVQRRRGGAMPVGRFALLTVLILFAVSAIRLAPAIGDYFPSGSATAAPQAGPRVYLVLLDGYPRIDSLAELGIDNAGFISQLEQRGFDHYPDATSAHAWTIRTLAAMVAGSPDGIPDESGTTAEKQRIRSDLQLPGGYLVIDPPASHATTRGGMHLSAGVINDFEIGIVGASVIGSVAADWAAGVVGSGLRSHFEASLELVTGSSSRRVFAHLMAPHPPFVYADGVATCWPGCGIFEANADELGISTREWGEQMARNLPAVNERILATIDELLAADPDTVIVLFSDHGGRYGAEGDEWHRSFLAARTPGHPTLFADEPHPHALLRLIGSAYP